MIVGMCQRKVEGEGLLKVGGHKDGEILASCTQVVQIPTLKYINSEDHSFISPPVETVLPNQPALPQLPHPPPLQHSSHRRESLSLNDFLPGIIFPPPFLGIFLQAEIGQRSWTNVACWRKLGFSKQ